MGLEETNDFFWTVERYESLSAFVNDVIPTIGKMTEQEYSDLKEYLQKVAKGISERQELIEH